MEEHRERRSRLDAAFQEEGGALLVFSGHGLSHGETFRQADDFAYLVGLELPGSLFVSVPGPAADVLFVPDTDARFESASRPNDFPGRPLGLDDAVAAWVPDARVRGADGIAAYLDSLVAAGTVLHVALGDDRELPEAPRPLHDSETEAALSARALMERWPAADVRSAFPLMARLRAIKSTAEVSVMEQAARATARAIVLASREVSPGTDERRLEGAFLDGCRTEGSARVPFAPIIKSGPNSLWPWRILASHYGRRNRTMLGGDLVIFDVGCEVHGYVSDVGRTLPVSGTFTERQREVLSMEVDVADSIIAAVRPGATLAGLKDIADRVMPPEARPYMQVGLFFGHHLGLSTGDPVLTDEPLEAGMVFTVEPWYYNHDEDLSVFTEDVILVTPTGARSLSAALPRRPEAIEEMMSAGVVAGLNGPQGETPLPATLEEIVDVYAAAWNDPDPDTRAHALSRVWAPGGRYRDPTGHVRGIPALVAHISGYQAGLPDAQIRRSGPVQRTAATFYFPWEIVARNGDVLASGKDAGVLDAGGRILEIRGFFDVP